MDNELFGERHEQEENGLFGKRHESEQVNNEEIKFTTDWSKEDMLKATHFTGDINAWN